MKTILAAVTVVLPLVSCSVQGESAKPGDRTIHLQEASMNFDLPQVGPFLEGVAAIIDAGFSVEDAKRLADKIADLPVEEEMTAEYTVTFRGAEMPLRIEVFMDDVDAPDLSLFAPSPLADAIDQGMDKFLE